MATIETFALAAGAVEGESAQVAVTATGENRIRLCVGPKGGRLRFAGPAAGGQPWPAEGALSVEVYHSLPLTLPVQLTFGGAGAEAATISANAGVLPDVRTRVLFPLSALNAETVFVPRTPGRLKMVVSGRRIEPDDVAWFTVGVGAIGEEGVVKLSDLRVLSEPEVRMPEGAPVTDDLGQWTARDWPGKTHGADELCARLRAADAAPAGDPPAGRTQYGGSAEIRFEATGFFRTQHDGRRWWLVDPDGGAFFSAGVDCIRPEAECNVAGVENLCTFLPPREGDYADAWLSERSFSWSVANLIRAFGSEWRPAWERLVRKWLVGWGFNTVANWSDLGFARRSGLPYVWPLADFPKTTHTIFRDFPDVFAPEYAAAARRFAAQLEPHRDDRNLIGYFLRNEPVWCFGQFRIAEELLSHEAQRAPGSRAALATFLSERYAGDAARFAAAWGGAVPRFDAVERILLRDPASLPEAARDDLAAFSRKMVDAYVRIPADACRSVDPNHLNLGMRWAWIASDDLLAGSDACDVFSMNMYSMAPNTEPIERAARASGRPVMIGEFHWGARDRGLPSTGLRAVASQAARGQAYRHYVEQGAAHPDLVGVHYFQMNDQPVLGRYDGENYQIGVVDVCWKPYEEFVAAARQTHERLYDVASGRVAPFAEGPEELPRVGF